MVLLLLFYARGLCSAESRVVLLLKDLPKGLQFHPNCGNTIAIAQGV